MQIVNDTFVEVIDIDADTLMTVTAYPAGLRVQIDSRLRQVGSVAFDLNWHTAGKLLKTLEIAKEHFDNER